MDWSELFKLIGDTLDKMEGFVKQQDWDGLEANNEELCSALAGEEQAKRIADVNLSLYAKALRDNLITAIRHANKVQAKAVYFEYDLDNDWGSSFTVCSNYQAFNGKREEWEMIGIGYMDGPYQPQLCEIYLENGFADTKEAVGSTSYLIARTLAAFGRATEGIDFDNLAICVAYHDQEPIVRFHEPTSGMRITSSQERQCCYCLHQEFPYEGTLMAWYSGRSPIVEITEGIAFKAWDAPRFEFGRREPLSGEYLRELSLIPPDEIDINTIHWNVIKGGELTDVLNNDRGWLIISRRVKDILTQAGVGPDQVQWLEVRVDNGERESDDEYFIANLIGEPSSAELEIHKGEESSGWTFSAEFLDDVLEGTRIFRLGQGFGRVYFSPRLKTALDQAGISGVEWLPTPLGR